ncbi:hypothetical protein T4D_9910 [Trichinella pseudospiralis]|uniref:Uncharacterized protein n=1 Tax=Trichinella pseudospiralis TaxID=6337 RepID=A0A0V1FIY9_TRIPS|nr:hypothetical protein T4D_9910 [Trichinella pseudospiralis]
MFVIILRNQFCKSRSHSDVEWRKLINNSLSTLNTNLIIHFNYSSCHTPTQTDACCNVHNFDQLFNL